MTRRTYHGVTATPAQIRSFRLLTLAQMVHLESIGVSMTGRSARRQAMEALDLNHATGAGLVDTGDLIEGLRDLSKKSLGLIDADAPRAPLQPQPEEGY